ncbi:MAG: hypothetical protein Q7S74_06310 [Nanoarchaeota archaeon]|nr:hypothetical protein [Nanoarchaeota archaeon]
MGTIEDIRAMQKEGKSEQEIRMSMMQRGVPLQQVSDSFSQLQIKDAVSFSSGVQNSGDLPNIPSPGASNIPVPQDPSYGGQSQGAYEGMEPSIIGQEVAGEVAGGMYSQQPGSYGAATQDYAGGDYAGGVSSVASGQNAGGAYDQYGTYQPYQGEMSSDIISEIAEQVVSEKLAPLQEKFEKLADFRTVAEARIGNIDERLRRLEQIIDRLQLSLLQKVGEYVTDVRDIKYELTETQKSFKALLPQLKNIGQRTTKESKEEVISGGEIP